MAGTTYQLASEPAMREQLRYSVTEYCVLRDWTESYIELAGAQATAEQIFNHILITAFRELVRDPGLKPTLNEIDLRPTLKLVCAVLEQPAEGPAAWRELYEAGLIDQKSFQGAVYHDEGDAVGRFLEMFANEVHPSIAAQVEPPVPARGTTLCAYVVDFIDYCNEKLPFPHDCEVNRNMEWSTSKRLLPDHHPSMQ